MSVDDILNPVEDDTCELDADAATPGGFWPPDPGLPERGAPIHDHWVRRAADKPAGHECVPPMREQWITPPPASVASVDPEWEHTRRPPPKFRTADTPDGDPGDLWRCRCGRLWTVVVTGGLYANVYTVEGAEWRPAGLWRRLRSVGR